MYWMYEGMAIAARIDTTTMVIMSSIRVKPDALRMGIPFVRECMLGAGPARLQKRATGGRIRGPNGTQGAVLAAKFHTWSTCRTAYNPPLVRRGDGGARGWCSSAGRATDS